MWGAGVQGGSENLSQYPQLKKLINLDKFVYLYPIITSIARHTRKLLNSVIIL